MRYAKEFFGDEEVCISCGNNTFDNDGCYENPSDDYCPNCGDDNPNNYREPAFPYHSKRILGFLQEGDKTGCEEYIWKHCLFNTENK